MQTVCEFVFNKLVIDFQKRKRKSKKRNPDYIIYKTTFSPAKLFGAKREIQKKKSIM